MLKFLKVLLMIVICGALKIEEPAQISDQVTENVEDTGEAGLEIYENTALGLAYNQMIEAKVAAGTAANKTLALDYVLLSVVFRNQAQICGGTLVTDQWILTSATCVQE
jgi:Trypsin